MDGKEPQGRGKKFELVELSSNTCKGISFPQISRMDLGRHEFGHYIMMLFSMIWIVDKPLRYMAKKMQML